MTEPNAATDTAPRAAGRRNSRTSDEIFHDIVRGLYEGRHVPGQRLVEADLTQQYGVSRGAVRDALRRLSAEGLVQLSLHKGAQIRRLSRKDMRDILVLVEVLTGLSARLSAERIAEADVRDSFTRRYEELMSYADRTDSRGFIRARNRFFRNLVEISGNPELQRVMPSLHLHLIRVQVESREVLDEMERFGDYTRIGEAVLAGRATRAELAARRHVRRLSATIQHLPDDAF